MARQQNKPLRRGWTTGACDVAAGHLGLHSAPRRVDTAALGAMLAALGAGAVEAALDWLAGDHPFARAELVS
jgi:cobalamin biosynthesis protein CbiD